MQWRGRRQSSNVEDRRGISPRGIMTGGLGTVVIALVFYLLGGDPTSVIDPGQNTPYTETTEDKELVEFVSVVLAETEDVWHKIFNDAGTEYREPSLVLFNGQVQSACGIAGSSTGPFYCSGDEKLFIDLSFYDDLQNQYNAPGDFAMAYVIAHEVVIIYKI